MSGAIHWRCFHCGEKFTRAQEPWAREHFGRDCSAEPFCMIRTAGEGELLTALRRAEDELAEHRAGLHPVLTAMQAIAAHIDATRAIERHGVGTLEEAFAGFAALPAPGQQPWRAVLGFRPDERVTREMIQTKRREMARLHHADAGGTGSRMAEINAAADEGLAEVARA